MGCVSTPWGPTGVFATEDTNQTCPEQTVRILMSVQETPVHVNTSATTHLGLTSVAVHQALSSTEMVGLARIWTNVQLDNIFANTTASTQRGATNACAHRDTNSTGTGAWTSMNVLNNRVFVLLPVLARIPMAVSDVSVQEVTSWMILEHSVWILTSVMMILGVMTAARIVLGLINVDVQRDFSFTCISISVSTKMNVLNLTIPVGTQSVRTLLVATTVAAPMDTNLTRGCPSVCKVLEVVTTPPALLAATQLETRASAATVQEDIRVLEMVTVWPLSILRHSTVLGAAGTMRRSTRKEMKTLFLQKDALHVK